jgi:outer membrane protein assembly factor BamB
MLVYNTAGTMVRSLKLAAAVLFGLALVSCASRAARPLVDPFPLRFPLVEVGSLDIEGHIAGQPRARAGIVYYATREGDATAVVVPSRCVLWRRPIVQTDLTAGLRPGVGVATGDLSLRTEGSEILAVGPSGATLWEHAVEGAISAEPAVRGDRVYFGTTERMFYCLSAKSGKKLWSRRLQGAPLHPAIVIGKAVVVAASNSVVYRLSAKGGSVLSWEAVPSRIVYEPAAAGTLVLVSSATPTLFALDPRTGKRAGQYEAPGLLVCGAVWAPPFVVLFVEDRDSARQRIVFLRPR